MNASNYWNFWYTGANGERHCGNLCIIAFSILGIVIAVLIIIACLKFCYFIKKKRKRDKKKLKDLGTKYQKDEELCDNCRANQDNMMLVSSNIKTCDAKSYKFHNCYLEKKGIIQISNDDKNGINFKQESNTIVQANYPLIGLYHDDYFPTLSNNIKWFHYYEVIIVSNPDENKNNLTIGLATRTEYNSLPDHSIKYCSVNGKKCYNETFLEYGANWGKAGDIIGCGYYPQTGQIFFTLNGEFQGITFIGLTYDLFPTISSEKKCVLEVNFDGEEKRFEYKEAIDMSICGKIR